MFLVPSPLMLTTTFPSRGFAPARPTCWLCCFPYEVVLDVDVFRSGVKLWILGQGNGSLVVPEDHGGWHGLPSWSSSSCRRLRSQMASFAGWVFPMYSASHEERATVGCRFDDQLMAPLPGVEFKAGC